MLQALRTPAKRTLARCTCLSAPSTSSSPARHIAHSAPSRSLFPPKDPSSTAAAASSFSRPAPPALPPHLQREFEALVKRAQTPAAPGVDLAELEEGQEMHPDVVKRPKPEFEGDENPNTGERGGPKREPLVHGDWAYGGKVTDF